VAETLQSKEGFFMEAVSRAVDGLNRDKSTYKSPFWSQPEAKQKTKPYPLIEFEVLRNGVKFQLELKSICCDHRDMSSFLTHPREQIALAHFMAVLDEKQKRNPSPIFNDSEDTGSKIRIYMIQISNDLLSFWRYQKGRVFLQFRSTYLEPSMSIGGFGMDNGASIWLMLAPEGLGFSISSRELSFEEPSNMALQIFFHPSVLRTPTSPLLMAADSPAYAPSSPSSRRKGTRLLFNRSKS